MVDIKGKLLLRVTQSLSLSGRLKELERGQL